MAALHSAVEDLTCGHLDSFADATAHGRAANFQELVGYPLSVAVVGELIGVPAADRPRFRKPGSDASRLLEPVRSEEDWARADAAVTELQQPGGGVGVSISSPMRPPHHVRLRFSCRSGGSSGLVPHNEIGHRPAADPHVREVREQPSALSVVLREEIS